MSKQQSFDHHYIPQFYLRRWAGPDGLICEFSRPHRHIVIQRKSPRAAGFQRHLYTVNGLPEGEQSILEDSFFRKTDQIAHDALRFMLGNGGGDQDMSAKLRSGWSRFILSLKYRSPEGIAMLKDKCRQELPQHLAEIETHYDERRSPSHPPTFAQFREEMEHDVGHKLWAVLLQDVIDNKAVGTFLNQMRWAVVTISGAVLHPFLTSDRPIYMTDGIKHPEGQIIVPVGPTQMFVAVNTPEMMATLQHRNPCEVMRAVNDKVVAQAQRYVYGTDARQLRFIENRLMRSR